MKLADRLASLSPPKAIAIGLALAAGYYFFMAESDQVVKSNITSLKSSVREQERKLAGLKDIVVNRKELETKRDELMKQMEFVAKYMPTDLKPIDVIKLVGTTAKAAGNNIVSIQEKPEASAGEHYDPISVDATLQGSFVQLSLFLTQLTRVNKIVVAANMEITSVPGEPGSGQNLNFRASITGFRAKPIAPPPAPADPGAPAASGGKP